MSFQPLLFFSHWLENASTVPTTKEEISSQMSR